MTEPAYEDGGHVIGLPPDVQTIVGVIDGLRARIADLNGLMDMMRENAVDREERIAELEAELDVVVEDEIRASRGNWTAEAVLDRLRARAEAKQEEAP